MRRINQAWPWLLMALAVGLFAPSLVLFVLQVGPAGRSAGDAALDILDRQFASGHNLFIVALLSLTPFVVLDWMILKLPAPVSSQRVACVAVCGVLGILALMIPTHWSVWAPLYVPGSPRGSSTSVLALLAVPFVCIVPMLVGVVVGWLVSSLVWFRQGEHPSVRPTGRMRLSDSDSAENPPTPRPEAGPYGSALRLTDNEAVTWYRRNSVCSMITVAHVVVMLFGGCVPWLSLLGIFTTIGIIVVCVVVLTGPVYYDRRGKDGTLVTWSRANKVAAVILLVLFVGGYGALVYYLVANAKLG